MTLWTAGIVGAYLVGSIPFGVLIARSRGINIRKHGSRNIGATNVGRVLGRRFGILCFALDVLKGAAPVIAAGAATGVFGTRAADLTPAQMWLWLAVAMAAVLGHMHSIFLRFAGGKGVATGLGAITALWPLLTLPALAALLVWIIIVKTTRYVSIASVCAACIIPLAYVARVALLDAPRTGEGALEALAHGHPPLIVAVLLAAFVVFKHRGNLARVRRGEEPKIGAAVSQ